MDNETILSFVAFCFSITGVRLNAKKNILSWYVWCIADILWFIYGLFTKQWFLFLLHTVYFASNIYGLRTWGADIEGIKIYHPKTPITLAREELTAIIRAIRKFLGKRDEKNK